MATKIEDLVARLQQQAAEVGVARKALNENTVRAQAAFEDTEQQVGLIMSGLTIVPRELEAEQARFAALEERRALVLSKLTEVERQLANAPDWRQAGDGSARDKEYDRQQHLKQQLQLLRSGALLFAPNQTYERLDNLDARLKKSKARIESLRAQLAAHLRQAEQLLGEPVSS